MTKIEGKERKKVVKSRRGKEGKDNHHHHVNKVFELI